MLPAPCALMPVLYSAGLTVALHPPLACCFTPLFPSPLHLMQFADNLSNSLREAGEALGQGGCESLGSSCCLTIAPKIHRLLPKGCRAAALGGEGQGLDQGRAQPGLGCRTGGAVLVQWDEGEDSVHQQGKETQALERGLSLYFVLV